MAGTRITHHLIYVDPGETVDIPHTDRGALFPLAVTFTGGGNKRYVINVIQLEPYDDDPEEEPATAPEPEPQPKAATPAPRAQGNLQGGRRKT